MCHVLLFLLRVWYIPGSEELDMCPINHHIGRIRLHINHSSEHKDTLQHASHTGDTMPLLLASLKQGSSVLALLGTIPYVTESCNCCYCKHATWNVTDCGSILCPFTKVYNKKWWSRIISFTKATGFGLDGRGSILGRGRIVCSPRLCPGQLWVMLGLHGDSL
jgi:hypothetical protein